MDALQRAYAVLPWWVGWGALVIYLPLAVLTAAVSEFVAISVAAWPMRRIAADAPWWERARLLFPIRMVGILNLILATVAFAALPLAALGPVSRVPRGAAALICGAAAFIAAGLVRWRKEDRILGRRLSLPARLRATAGLWLVFLPHFALLPLFLSVLPDRFTAGAILLLAVYVVCLVAYACGFGLRIAARMGLVRPLGARYAGVMNLAADRAGVRPRACYELDSEALPAAAMPLAQALLFSRTALEALTDEELAAVCAHELAHLSESPRVRAGRLLSVLLYVPLAATRPLFGTFGLLGLEAGLVIFVIGVMVAQKLGQRLEVRADALALEQEGDPGAYARAMARISELNLIPAVIGSRSASHPELYDRLTAAGAPPDYPRPKRPPRAPALLAGVLSGIVCGVCLLTVLAPTLLLRREEGAALWSAALFAKPRSLAHLGWLRARRGDSESGVILLAAAAEAAPRSVSYPAHLAYVLARARRVPEAASAAAEAIRRFDAKGRPEDAREDYDEARAILRWSRRGRARSGTRATR